MASLKQDEISGVTVGAEWIAKTDSTYIQAVDEGVIVQKPSGERIFYPWSRVDNVKLISKPL